MKISNLILLLALSIPWTVGAQSESQPSKDVILMNKVKRFAIGVKAGSPIGIGGSVEAVLPIGGNRLAPYLDISRFNDIDVDDVFVDHKYLEYGFNLYFGQRGIGFYLGLGTSSTTTDFAYADEIADSGNAYIGEATTSIDLDLVNIKLGFKTGRTVYFRIELGYGFGEIPQELVITGTTEVMGVRQTETSIEEIPDIPGWGENGMLIGNISIGLSF